MPPAAATFPGIQPQVAHHILVYTTENGYWTTNSSIWEFPGNGDGTLQPGIQLFTRFQPMTMADVNGDSWLDLVSYDFFWPDGTTETWGTPKFTTFLDQASGKFSKSSSYSPYAGVPEQGKPYLQFGDPLTSSKVADLNGDGKLDEIAFQETGQTDQTTYAQILMGNGDGTFTPTYDMFPFFKDLSFPDYAGHFDGTVFSNLLEIDGATSSMHLFKGGPAPTFQLALEEAEVTGNSGCGWIFLNVAGTSDTSLSLSSSVPGVVLPASVTVPGGSLSQQFCYTLDSSFDWHRVFDITAQLGADSAFAYASQAYVVGFSENLAPAGDQVIYPSQSTQPITVTLTSSQGYSTTAQLSCANLPQDATCVFGAPSLTITSGGTASTTVVIETTSTSSGGGLVTVSASDANVTSRQSFNVAVQPLVVDPIGLAPQATSPGTGSTGIMIVGLPPYKPSCTGLPTGVNCAFSGAQLPYPSDTDLEVSITVPAGIAPGTYPFTVLVSSGGIQASTAFTLTIQDFTLQAPSDQTDWAPVGGTASVGVGVVPVENFTGTVNVTCSLSFAGTCTGSTINVVSGFNAVVNLAVTVPSTVPLGAYTIAVNATDSPLSHSATFPFYVADFSGSLGQSSITMAEGASKTLVGTVNATTGFGDTVTFSCSGSIEITCSFSPATVAPTASSPATTQITVTAAPTASLRLRSASFNGFLGLAAVLPLGVMTGLRRRIGSMARMRDIMCLLVLSVGVLSCGGQGGATGGGGGGHGSNNYSITVSATASGTALTHSIGTISVTVTH